MEPNFIIVPQPDPLAVLWSAFPELRDRLDVDSSDESYYVYARLAEYLASHRDDDHLWRRAYPFFDSLAVVGGDLQDLLVIELLEPLCDDPVLAGRLKANAGPSALKLLREMTDEGTA